MPKYNPNFDLEVQYQLYLQRVKLSESTMHPEQKRQVKQGFMGACGQMLILLRDDVGKLSETEAVVVFESMLEQVGSFWTKEVEEYKARNQ